MKVLVAYASRHGATAEIAKRMAESLLARGIDATVSDVNVIDDLAGYDAVILGSAAYLNRWLKDARRFADTNHRRLAGMRVWLFSSGPTGTGGVDQDLDTLESARPKDMIQLDEQLGAEGTKVFFGAYDPTADPIGAAETFIDHFPRWKAEIPAGDFRDWDAIEAWVDAIASSLQPG
jgi:menaquinone-dependent protoporphyrinogen oxidase